MTHSSPRLLCVAFLFLALSAGGAARSGGADDPPDSPPPPADSPDEFFAPPEGDPWYTPPPQQHGSRPSAGAGLAFKTRIAPHWFDGSRRFWYRNDLAGGTKEFVLVDAEHGRREPAFDHQKLARALSKAAGGKTIHADRLPFNEIEFTTGAKAVRFTAEGAAWTCALDSYDCSKIGQAGSAAATPAQDENQPRGPRTDARTGLSLASRGGTLRSPDGKWTARVKDHNVFVCAEGTSRDIELSRDGKDGLAYRGLYWSPDSKTLVALRTEPGDGKEVYLIQSSPPGGGRARMRARPYPLPGDKFPSFELNIFDVATGTAKRPTVDRTDSAPALHWDKDGRHFAYEKIDRGHQRYRLIRVDSHTGEARNLIDETSKTFIWTAHREGVALRTVSWLDETGEILYASERDGWRHLYLIDAATGSIKNQITRGAYVVRGVDLIDEAKREVWFHASGKNPDEDPYFVHYYRINFDGSGLVALTGGNGNHNRSVQFSPDRRFLIDTYSCVDKAPVHELRRTSDGTRVCRLEEADITRLLASGWRPPEVFVAKGRDGETDIWGIICRPKDFDPQRKYPVIEQIYAGPQGSFVPKSWSADRRFAALADLGFIVVQIDGMGTANRSKAFHDVCWHNLKDAGFPDRILWHQAVARKYPYYDLTKVGITGTSAGGQNATAGVLFHPEFYHAAAAACGCHDNRMDKASWNEQWMGYPVGPWYSESSNIDNAKRLRGKLLLIVGEMDTNVPPESTMRLVDALIRANKDFELLVVPNANHGMGGAYGQRRMLDFFVRHLKGGDAGHESAHPRRDAEAARAATNGQTRSSAVGPTNPRTGGLIGLAEENDDRSELRGAIERYMADRGSLFRSAPPAASAARDDRFRSFTKEWLDQLDSVDFDRLCRDGQVDFLLFKNHLAHELRQLDLRARERGEAQPMVPFARPILGLESARRELKPMDWSKVAADVTRLAREIGEARKALERASAPKDRSGAARRTANRALASVEDLRGTLRDWFAFYDGYDPLFSWWLQEPYKSADSALEAYAGFLRQRLGAVTVDVGGPDAGFGPGRRRGGGSGGGPPQGRGEPRGPNPSTTAAAVQRDSEIIGNPIGRDALGSELEYEMIAYSPDELIDLARKELAFCEGEMKKAARELGHGDDWHRALEHVKTLHVEPGRQPALIRDLAIEAIDYLDAHNLVTVPPLCRDSWRMTMMSPERQLISPFFLGGETIMVSFPTNTMPHDAKMMSMRGNNIHFSRATVFHELIPGHHLQGFMTARHKTYRRLFNTPFWTEGWALYWELLLWDRGFAKTPENKIGMLFWRMHRCARIIFSLGFHLEQMTPQQCIDFLVERVGHERDNATAEVRRSFTTTYGPLYQAAYLLGGLQLKALHRDLVESGKMTDRDFHDAILKQNGIPIEMVRALLTEERLSSDYSPSWKFYPAAPGQN
jgi:dipeptidyl aminopeptidase/acylaminoacyl peptidase